MSASLRLFWGLGLCLSLLLMGCSNDNISDRDVQILSLDGYDKLVTDLRRTTQIVDVRHPDDYAAGHIPNAINVPLPEIVKVHEYMSGYDRVIVYAGGYNDALSLAAAKKLIRMDYKEVHDFRGGIELWTAEGRELETGP